MNKPFNEGYKVYSVEFGHGTVVQEIRADLVYDVVVRFDIGRDIPYTDDGRRINGVGILQTLFHANSGRVEFNTAILPNLKVDQLVWVRDPGHSRPDVWYPRHFAEFKYDRIFCFAEGRTSLTNPDSCISRSWEHYSLTDPHKKAAS